MSVIRRPLDYGLLRFVAVCAISALALTPFLQPKYHCNSNALTVVVTVFSMLAGFLVAVMAIAGDERALRGRNWRDDTFYLRSVKNDLLRLRVMFYLYLTVLALTFLASLKLGWPMIAQVWAERLLVFFAVFSGLLSFDLPRRLTGRYIQTLDKLVRERRDRETGVPPKR